MAISRSAPLYPTARDAEPPAPDRDSLECRPAEVYSPLGSPCTERDEIAEITANLSEDCDVAFSRPHPQFRSRSSSFTSYNPREETLNRIRPYSRGKTSMASNNTLEMDDLRSRWRVRDSEPHDDVPEIIDSYGTSKRSSMSRPSSAKYRNDNADSAIDLPQPKDKHRKSYLREAQSASDGPEADEAAPVYPSATKTAIIMVSLYISIFLVALDRTIIGPAIPAITNEFNSIGDIGWYGSAYMLTAAGFMLLYGRVYTFFPTKPVFMSGICLFETGSVVCGASTSSMMLIIGRAIAGLGSGGIFTGAILIMLNTVPLAKRPMLQGLFGACFGVASVAGPLLGGAFTESKATWRWCFYINLPLGALTILVVCFMLKLEEKKPKLANWKETIKHLDPLGTALFLPSITCLLLALEWGAADYPWSAPRIIALLVVFAVLLVAFVAWQYFTRNTTATVPARIIIQRSIAFGGASQFCVGATMLTVSIYIPLWFQAIKGASAVQSGVNTIPLVLSVVVGSIMSGGLVQKIGYYTPFMILGSCLMAIGTGLITTWNMSTNSSMWIGYQVIVGFGVGSTMQHPNIAVQTVLPKHDVPIGTALLSLCQTLGGAVFTAVGQNLYIDKFTAGLERIDGIDPQRILGSGATDLTSGVQPELQQRILAAYNNSLTQGTFFAALIIACLAVPAALGMEWRSVKEKQVLTPATRDVEKEVSRIERSGFGGIAAIPRTGSHEKDVGELSLPPVRPPIPARNSLYRISAAQFSGDFSSYFHAKVNPDLRQEPNTRRQDEEGVF